MNVSLARLRRWEEGGERLVESIPGGKWQTGTLVRAAALDRTRAAIVLDGPIHGDRFASFCEWLWDPALVPGDLVVMDHLSSHKSVRAIHEIGAVGARIGYLQPYSIDLSPIE